MRNLITIISVGVLLSTGSSLLAQQGSFLDLDKLLSKSSLDRSSSLGTDVIPTDDVIYPEMYRVGPGDVITYFTTSLDFMEKVSTITPENTLLIERVGMLNVNGLTLQQVRDSVSARLKRRTPEVDVFLTLKRARTIYVTVRGNVQFPGTYAVPASMRVSTLLTVCRQPWLLRKDAVLNEQVRALGAGPSQRTMEITRSGSPQLSAYALRNIVVRHRDGVTLVDLARSRMKDGNVFDPHLREGDVVNVPFDNGMQPTVSIAGAVATPATMVFKPGDRASLLLAAAGGALNDADLDRVTLVQAGGSGKVILKVDEHLNIIGEDPELQPGSSIIVEKRVMAGDQARQGVVEVYGEVGSPGSVVITPGVTRIADVLRLAGGVKPTASLNLSYIVRPDDSKHSQRDRIEDASRRFMYSDLKLEDTLRYQLDQNYRVPYVSCNMQEALRDTTSAQNVPLNNGDIVVIESTPNHVFVYGQVNQPGYVAFTPGKRLDWYVEQAGGFATGAQEGRSRIIRGKSKVWVEDAADAYVEPGDEVYVPRPPDIPAGVELQTYAVIAGILSSVAAITATIISLSR